MVRRSVGKHENLRRYRPSDDIQSDRLSAKSDWAERVDRGIREMGPFASADTRLQNRLSNSPMAFEAYLDPLVSRTRAM